MDGFLIKARKYKSKKVRAVLWLATSACGIAPSTLVKQEIYTSLNADADSGQRQGWYD